MAIPQTGIFALGDAAHVYMEFTRVSGTDAKRLVQTVVDIHEPHQTIGGSNVVIGFRPELWREVNADATPAGLLGFNEPLAGSEGYSMPATQSDLWIWIAGASYDNVFDLGREAIAKLRSVATLDRHLNGWSYKHSRDLTGFEDGTKNPSLMIAPGLATIPNGAPGAGGSVLLYQQWQHQCRPETSRSDVAPHVRCGRRHTRCAYAVFHAADGFVLLRPVAGGVAAVRRTRRRLARSTRLPIGP